MNNKEAKRPTRISWYGDVPAHWRQMRLKDTVDGCVNGFWGDEALGDGRDTQVIRVADFNRNERRVTEGPTFRFIKAEQRGGRALEPGDLLIEKSGGGELQPVGMVVQYEGEAGAVCSNFVARMRPREGVVGRYLCFLHAHLYERSVTTLSIKQSTGIQNLDSAAYLGEACFLPPPEEQVAIASYLDVETARIDALIHAKVSLKAKLEGFANSTFLAEVLECARDLPGKAVDRIQWLPTVPSAWSRCKVKHLVDHFDQGVSPQCESRPPSEDEWGVLKAGCINSGSFDPMESKALPPEIASIPEVTVEKGDLIISRANTQSLVGRSAVAQKDYPRLMLSDKLYRLKLDRSRCVPEFIRRTLWIPAVRQRIEERATGASPSMLNIDRRTILELDVVLPPVPEQLRLLEIVDRRADAVAELIGHVEREIDLLHDLRSSTITQAIVGSIDVRVSVHNKKELEAA